MDDLLESTKALVDMARSGGVLTPPIPSAAVDCMEWCVKEIERLRLRGERDSTLREVNRKNWIEAAEVAIDRGDFRPLKLRIDLSKSGPADFVETKTST